MTGYSECLSLAKTEVEGSQPLSVSLSLLVVGAAAPGPGLPARAPARPSHTDLLVMGDDLPDEFDMDVAPVAPPGTMTARTERLSLTDKEATVACLGRSIRDELDYYDPNRPEFSKQSSYGKVTCRVF